jgi:hypothetical protein
MSTLEGVNVFTGNLRVQWRVADAEQADAIFPMVSIAVVRGASITETLDGGSIVVRPPPGHRLRLIRLRTQQQLAQYLTTRLVPSDQFASLSSLPINARIIVGNVPGSHRQEVHHEMVPENVIPGWVSYVIGGANAEMVPESPPLAPLVRQDAAPFVQLNQGLEQSDSDQSQPENKENKEEKEVKEEKAQQVPLQAPTPFGVREFAALVSIHLVNGKRQLEAERLAFDDARGKFPAETARLAAGRLLGEYREAREAESPPSSSSGSLPPSSSRRRASAQHSILLLATPPVSLNTS